MTREEAIKWLSNLKMDIGKTQHQELWHYEQAIDEIIKVLKQEQKRGDEDLISRQDALDAIAKFVPYVIDDISTESYTNGLKDAYNLIYQLPKRESDGE